MGIKVRGIMSMALLAIRYKDPENVEDDIQVCGNYLSQIPEPLLRPLIRCLLKNQGKMDSGPFTGAETTEAKPLIEKWNKEFNDPKLDDVPLPRVDMKKWY